MWGSQLICVFSEGQLCADGSLENSLALEKWVPVSGGVGCGFVFTKEDLTEVKDSLLPNKMPAAAHADAIAPCGITGSGRPLFQALDIPLTSPGVISPLKF